MEAYDIKGLDSYHGLGPVLICQSFLSLTICVMFRSLFLLHIVSCIAVLFLVFE